MENKAVVQGKSIDFNRLVLESKNTRMLVLAHTDKKDKLKQRDSGLNHVLCKIAKDNSIILAFDMNELKIEDKKSKAKILARMMQNIKLMKKFKNKFRLLNFSNKQQAFSFLITLGLDTKMSKSAVE